MTKIKISKGFITQQSGKKLTIFDPEASIVYYFNETASFIFKNLQEGRGEGEIIKGIVKKFTVTEKRAEKDLEEFLEDLRKNKIIVEGK